MSEPLDGHRYVYLCPDCTQAAVNDDYSGVQFTHGSGDACDARILEIATGLDALGWLLCDDDDRYHGDDMSLDPCACCSGPRHGERTRFQAKERP